MRPRRLARSAIVFGGAPLLAAAVVVLAVWVEARFPSDDEACALSPTLQRAVTAPIVDAIGHQIERVVREWEPSGGEITYQFLGQKGRGNLLDFVR